MSLKGALHTLVDWGSFEQMEWVALGGLLASILAYLALASGSPGLALLTGSAFGFAAVLAAVVKVWPPDRKITVERQLEVIGYRLAAVLVVYYVVGFATLWGLNQISAETTRVPLAWEGPLLQPWANPFFRRVTFWPFYALVLVGCQGVGPTPPGAC